MSAGSHINSETDFEEDRVRVSNIKPALQPI